MVLYGLPFPATHRIPAMTSLSLMGVDCWLPVSRAQIVLPHLTTLPISCSIKYHLHSLNVKLNRFSGIANISTVAHNALSQRRNSRWCEAVPSSNDYMSRR